MRDIPELKQGDMIRSFNGNGTRPHYIEILNAHKVISEIEKGNTDKYKAVVVLPRNLLARNQSHGVVQDSNTTKLWVVLEYNSNKFINCKNYKAKDKGYDVPCIGDAIIYVRNER